MHLHAHGPLPLCCYAATCVQMFTLLVQQPEVKVLCLLKIIFALAWTVSVTLKSLSNELALSQRPAATGYSNGIVDNQSI